VCVCVCAYMSARVQYVWVCVRACVCVCVCAYMSARVHYVCGCVYVRVWVHVCVFGTDPACGHNDMCVSVFVYVLCWRICVFAWQTSVRACAL
jgi:hypothetical protein